MGRFPSPTLQWSMPHFSCCWMPSPLQAHWGRRCHTCLFQPACLFTLHVGKCLSSLLQWSFPHDSHCYKLSLLQGCWVGLPLLPSLAACLFTVHVRECPSPTLWSSGRPTLFAMCLFFFFCLSCLFVFSFFPGQGSVCPGAYADLFQGVPHVAHLLTWRSASPKQVRSVIWQHRSPHGFSV
jgi:hypothetical protein